MGPEDEARALDGVRRALRAEFPLLDDGVVDGHVDRAMAALAGAVIRDFVPVLVHRQARAGLRAGVPEVDLRGAQAAVARDPAPA